MVVQRGRGLCQRGYRQVEQLTYCLGAFSYRRGGQRQALCRVRGVLIAIMIGRQEDGSSTLSCDKIPADPC
jgi:hypothetical protein